MEKYFKKLLFLASGVILIIISLGFLNSGIIDSLKLEIRRYDGVNTWYLVAALLFVFASYLMGWITSKINGLDKQS